MIGASNRILAPTPAEAGQLVGLYRAEPEHIRLVPPGVDHRMFTPRDREAARSRLHLSGLRLALFVGRLQAHKGPDVAIRTIAEAIAREPETTRDLQLAIVGGPSGHEVGGARPIDGARDGARGRRPRDALRRRSRRRASPTSTRRPTSCSCRRGPNRSGSSRSRRRRAARRSSRRASAAFRSSSTTARRGSSSTATTRRTTPRACSTCCAIDELASAHRRGGCVPRAAVHVGRDRRRGGAGLPGRRRRVEVLSLFLAHA